MRTVVVALVRRKVRFAASFVSIALAVSCGLSPVEDLPSAVDGLNVDGLDDGLDLTPGVGGGSSAGSGGAPNCGVPLGYECRGNELWHVTVGFTCPPDEALVQMCSISCDTPSPGLAACDLLGYGGMGGYGGHGGSTNQDGQGP